MCAGSSQEDALYLSNLRDTAEVKWSYFYQFIIVIIVIRLIIVISWTMLRSKELRESLSRPSSRLSCENGMEKMGKDLVRKDHQYLDHWWQWWSHKSQHRLQRWYITIPSLDRWCTTIENHRYQWLSYLKTIRKPLIPMVALNHSIQWWL